MVSERRKKPPRRNPISDAAKAKPSSHYFDFWRIYPSWDAYVIFSRTTSASGSFLSPSSFSTATVADAAVDTTTAAETAEAAAVAAVATDPQRKRHRPPRH